MDHWSEVDGSWVKGNGSWFMVYIYIHGSKIGFSLLLGKCMVNVLG